MFPRNEVRGEDFVEWRAEKGEAKTMHRCSLGLEESISLTRRNIEIHTGRRMIVDCLSD